MHDALKRRLRFSPPQPLDKRIDLADSDVKVFEAIHRHGCLPTNYLFEFSDHENFNSFQQRLTKLYNGTPQGGYLARPPQQFANFHARYQHIVYDLNDRAKQLLHDQGKLSPFVHRVDPFVHRLMGACFTASLELALKENFIPRHDILFKTGSPMELPLSKFADNDAVVPDELFGVKNAKGYRFFACEWDRKTESIERSDKRQNTFARKVEAYTDVFKNKTFKEVWGVPQLMVMVVTTNQKHLENMLDYLKDKEYADRFLFKCLPMFGANWKIPPIIPLTPFVSVRGEFDIT